MEYEPRRILSGDIINLDYETTGFQNEPGARVFAASLTWVEDGYTEVWRNSGEVRIYDNEKEIKKLKSNFDDRLVSFWRSSCAMIAHNLKFELHFTAIMGWEINPEKVLHDTMIMSQYIDNLCPSHALDYCFNRFHGKCEWISDADKEVSKAAKIYGSYDKIPEELMFRYQLGDGLRGALLYKLFWPYVSPATEYLNEIELIKTTVQMERRGFMIDESHAKKLIAFMEKELISNESQTRKIAGRYVNLLSEKQLKILLFDDFKLPRLNSTDKNAILQLNHPIIDCIQKQRAYTKGIAMITGYLKAAQNGIVHPSIKTNHAGTGRESSENPNLQNVSKEIKVGTKYTVPARRCFRARPGYILLLVDYAGVEMRLAVQGTGDMRLFNLCDEGFDFHDACAKSFYGDKYVLENDKAIKKALRSRAKNARFAMLYGAGLEQTAATLGLTIEEVRAGYERDKKDFPEFYTLMEKCMHDAKHQGYIETFFGRKLRVPRDRIYSATDYLIQGSAAALFKHAQNAVNDLFKGTDCHIIIPVHDELVMEVPRGTDLISLTKNITKRMLDFPQIKVKLDVEYSIATYTWDKKSEYKPDSYV